MSKTHLQLTQLENENFKKKNNIFESLIPFKGEKVATDSPLNRLRLTLLHSKIIKEEDTIILFQICIVSDKNKKL